MTSGLSGLYPFVEPTQPSWYTTLEQRFGDKFTSLDPDKQQLAGLEMLHRDRADAFLMDYYENHPFEKGDSVHSAAVTRGKMGEEQWTRLQGMVADLSMRGVGLDQLRQDMATGKGDSLENLRIAWKENSDKPYTGTVPKDAEGQNVADRLSLANDLGQELGRDGQLVTNTLSVGAPGVAISKDSLEKSGAEATPKESPENPWAIPENKSPENPWAIPGKSSGSKTLENPWGVPDLDSSSPSGFGQLRDYNPDNPDAVGWGKLENSGNGAIGFQSGAFDKDGSHGAMMEAPDLNEKDKGGFEY